MTDDIQLPDDELEIEDDAPETPVDKSKLVSERIKKAKLKAIEETRAQILAELGATDLESVKSSLKEKAERDQANMSELDKAQKALEKLTKERDTALATIQQMQSSQRLSVRNAQILKAAGEAEHPADVVTWVLTEHASDIDEATGEDGVVDEKRLKKLIEACQTARPKWFRRNVTPIPSNTPNTRNTGGIPDEPEEDLIKKAKKKGYFG